MRVVLQRLVARQGVVFPLLFVHGAQVPEVAQRFEFGNDAVLRRVRLIRQPLKEPLGVGHGGDVQPIATSSRCAVLANAVSAVACVAGGETRVAKVQLLAADAQLCTACVDGRAHRSTRLFVGARPVHLVARELRQGSEEARVRDRTVAPGAKRPVV